MKASTLKNYAKLIVKVGVNVQKGQEVVVRAGLDQPKFVEYVVDECYKSGAKRVVVDWEYQPLTKLAYRHESTTTLSTVTDYEEMRLKYRSEKLPAMIYLKSLDPDGLKGVNQTKLGKVTRAITTVSKPYRNKMDQKYQWCIAAVPGEKWAKKVFPNDRTSVAVEKLWDAILKCSRCDDDPIGAWEEHNRDLADRCKYLNSLGITELHYKSSNGTDFKVGMNEDGIFLGGAHETLSGVTYNANIPSEECFISPKKGKAEGVLVSSKPLAYQGQVIDEFSIFFKDGKVSDVKAKENEDLLREIVNMDDGAKYLGECALVPYESPIRKTGLLFYQTLFDENAACHMALGRGFTNTVKDFEKYTFDELHEKGINDSLIHVDFMIGTADTEITAKCKNGKKVQIFKNGTWAF